MVAIGGMQGVLDEARIFNELRPGRPIFALKTTGGAAAVLANRQQENQPQVHVIDSDAEELVRKFWSQQEQADEPFRKQLVDFSDFYVPYAFIAQEMIAKLTDRRELT